MHIDTHILLDRRFLPDLMVAIIYPFCQFCEINISLLSLQTQPDTAPNLFQRGVEYGKYGSEGRLEEAAAL